MGGCSSTGTQADLAKQSAAAEKVRDQAEDERLKRKTARLQEKVDATPKWALEPMRIDADAVYAVGFGESDNPAIAIKKATLEAEFGLAKKYRLELSGQERLAVSDRGKRAVSQGYGQMIDALIASVPMNGHQVVEQVVKPIQGQVSAWVLMKMTHEQMQAMAKRESGAAEDDRVKAGFAELERRIAERRAEELRLAERRHEMRMRELAVAGGATNQVTAERAATTESVGVGAEKANGK
jgi:hypothetical protein